MSILYFLLSGIWWVVNLTFWGFHFIFPLSHLSIWCLRCLHMVHIANRLIELLLLVPLVLIYWSRFNKLLRFWICVTLLGWHNLCVWILWDESLPVVVLIYVFSTMKLHWNFVSNKLLMSNVRSWIILNFLYTVVLEQPSLFHSLISKAFIIFHLSWGSPVLIFLTANFLLFIKFLII